MSKIVVGDPLRTPTPIWVLWSRWCTRDKVAGMVARARAVVRRIVTGGEIPDLPGSYFRPTLVADVAEDSEIYRDEIFGPVLTVRPHDGDDDAIRQPTTPTSDWRAPRGLVMSTAPSGRHVRSMPLSVDQRPHSDHQRDAARWLRRVRLRWDMSDYSFEEYLSIKHVMSDITGAAERTGTESFSPSEADVPSLWTSTRCGRLLAAGVTTTGSVEAGEDSGGR